MNTSPSSIDRPKTTSALAREIEQGYATLQEGRWDEALTHGLRLAEKHPQDHDVLTYVAEASLAQGDMREALAWIDKAIDASHNSVLLKVKKARLLIKMRRRAEVAQLLASLRDQVGNNGGLHWELGKICYRTNHQPEAIAHYEKARRLLGDQPGLLYDLAVSRFFSGDFDRAESDLDRTLSLAPQFGHALYLRATLRRQTPEKNHLKQITDLLARGITDPGQQASALYALSKELEDLGEHSRAFAALYKGAQQKRSTFQYDGQAESESLAAIAAAYTREFMEQSCQGHDDDGPIFIVGMPRTGTTLLERILTQSSSVKSAGELLDFGTLLATATELRSITEPDASPALASLGIDFAALGREYVRGAREAAGGSSRFIDKMPINYIYCGMIRKALPKARIIHLVRDPIDCCYAVFKTQFFQAYNFSYDLEELANYYIAYHHLMRHWHQVMPGAILDVRYEDFVADPEAQAKRVFDWCGLDWNPAVLDAPDADTVFATASAAQVRQPIHARSVRSSRKHVTALAPLIKKLSDAGILLDEV